MNIIIITVVIAGLLLVFQRRNCMRLLTVLNAQIGKLIKWVWRKDVNAIYQAEIDRATDEISEANESLEKYKAMSTRLQRQVVGNEKQLEGLKQKIKDYLTGGNEEKAAEYAMQLRRVEKELNENRAQLKVHEDTYQNSLKKVKYANERVRQARERADKLQADLGLSKLEAETSKLAQTFNVKTSSLDGLSEVEDEIQRQIDTNRAKGQVIRDLSQDGLDEIEQEDRIQKEETKNLLEQIRQEMGMPNITYTVKEVEK